MVLAKTKTSQQRGTWKVCAVQPIKPEGEPMMFKKPDSELQSSELPAFTPAAKTSPVEHARESATIGPSIAIKGDLIGEEDLIIQGKVEGKVDLKQNSVTIGKNGRVKADIYAKLINVEGEVEGSLFGLEQIILRSTGSVRGNICAPRVAIEDGARFKGGIDMDGKSEDKGHDSTSVEAKISTPQGQPGTRPGIPIKTEASNTRIG
jgi:cytoskeletal protein CcmA (bactofilin family)